MEERPFYLAIDFDDTLRMRGSWGSEEGIPNEKVIELVKKLKEMGWKIIIWSCRPMDGYIEEWCIENGVPVDFYNENPDAIDWFQRNYGLTNSSL